MQIFKCDRCGAIYETYPKELESGFDNVMCDNEPYIIIKKKNLKTIDLCYNCRFELTKWMKKEIKDDSSRI